MSFDDVLNRLYAARVRMRFTRPALTGAGHWPGLAGFVKGLIGSELPPELWLAAPDAGVPAFGPEDEYDFVVYALESGLPALAQLLEKLAKSSQPPESELRGDSRAFGPRWVFVGADDVFSENAPIGRAPELRPLTLSVLQSEATLRSAVGAAWMRLLSPMQLLREREKRPEKGVGRYCQDASELSGALLLARLRQSLNAFSRRLGSEEIFPTPDARMEITGGDLFWHGTSQIDVRGADKPVFGLGGVIGLEVEGPDSEMVWQWLVLGQHLGIGQRRGFGLGRYRLEGPKGERIGILPQRRASVLTSSFLLPNLDAAWGAIRGNKQRAAFERELNTFTFGLRPDADRRTELMRMAEHIEHGEYTTPALEGIIVRKPDGGERALALPPLLDRVLQRAVAQALNRVIEPVMYARSFGYRPSRNRMQPHGLVQRLVRDGYTWFFESDIGSFFDAVDPVLIYNRLMSLLPDDMAIDQIMEWVTAPVRHQGRLIQRNGLPQGSPLSPLLANLVLDDFDKDLIAAGFKPVRFADDFVVPCKSREEAERAAEVVEQSLEKKGLTLNEHQSRVAPFSDGLKFLGYRFLDGLAIETKRPRNPVAAHEDGPQPGSWLPGATHSKEERPSFSHSATNALLDEPGPDQAGASVGEAVASGTLIVVSEPGCVLNTRDGQLWRRRPEQPAESIAPWPELGALLLLGHQSITQPVLSRCMDHQVPVHFTDRFGRLRGTLVSAAAHEPGEHWSAQSAACESQSDCLLIARELVATRISHQGRVLRRQGIRSDQLHVFSKCAQNAGDAESLESLRDIEGTAGSAYFAEVARLVPDWVGFQGRDRCSPRDPLNALLSLGYTMLYAQTETLIRIAGLNAGFGFYHQRRGRQAALALDLMVPFRHLVESTAIAQLNRRQLGEDAFKVDVENGCRFSDEGRRAFLVALGRCLSGCMTTSEGLSATGHQHMFRQAQALLSWIQDREQPFAATRLN
ncbi:MAG: CRISPR-associated endonuclease Cas1 [Wenzhouxiangellaceae bacterium]